MHQIVVVSFLRDTNAAEVASVPIPWRAGLHLATLPELPEWQAAVAFAIDALKDLTTD